MHCTNWQQHLLYLIQSGQVMWPEIFYELWDIWLIYSNLSKTQNYILFLRFGVKTNLKDGANDEHVMHQSSAHSLIDVFFY